MSLVLNTNTSGGGGYALSNSDITVMYPQTENNILLFPEYNASEYKLSALPTAYSVNGTVVNVITGILVAPHDVEIQAPATNGTNRGLSPNILLHMQNSPGTFRIGTPTPLQAGMVIGKTIIIPKILYAYYSSASIPGLEIKVGILHSDGTITYMATKDQSTISGSFNSANTGTYWTTSTNYSGITCGETTVITTNGYTTQAGDYVVADYNITSAMNYFLLFGNSYATRPQELISPVQISID